MRLCVGASSRRVVEEAAKLQVSQIVASRRQVHHAGGYIGLAPGEFVDLVCHLSADRTRVVRDHGGPRQGGFADDGVTALEIDADAGFHVLHIDVSALDQHEQAGTLVEIMRRFYNRVEIEIGGERDNQRHLDNLLHAVLNGAMEPDTVVVATGMEIWADRQRGMPRHPDRVRAVTDALERRGIQTKMHNADWYGNLRAYADAVTFCNVAPEFAAVEVDAILTVQNSNDVTDLLDDAYDGAEWERWFNLHEGTWLERAKCAMRYRLTEMPYKGWNDEKEEFVRERIRDAIIARDRDCTNL